MFWKKFLYLQVVFRLEQNLSGLWRQLFGSVVKTAVYMLEEQIEGNNILKNRTIQQEISQFTLHRFRLSVGIFCSFVQTAIYVLEELFEEKRLFWRKSKIQNVSGTVGKKFSLGLLKVFAMFPREKFHEKRTLLLKKTM